ncbi:hypothetical protein LUZ63_002953 [Rhynchospora breviuscula]|uniref:Uncharacterized protein n=1 Tax=Rhynchospora breviuscula TaxID=2022672 RepID=A0A9Q0D138_9POAL|nr:hypothetical protein LUZ63_002953 [Rhynchospora breviuscula]
MESAREARRRKILERGSDRMAMITAAQTRSDTPPTQQSDQARHNEVGARDHNSHSNLSRVAREETAPSIKENINSRVATTKDGIEEEQAERKANTPAASINPANQTEDKRMTGTKTINPWIFSPAEIGQAVSDTEIIRLIFVVFFSFLVIKGFISSKPMLLLLLTDLAIVAGFLILNKGEVQKHKKKKYIMPADKLGMIIEVAFLAQKVLGAIFMDSCIYAVIVICGMGI